MWLNQRSNLGRGGGKPPTNRLNYGTAQGCKSVKPLSLASKQNIDPCYLIPAVEKPVHFMVTTSAGKSTDNLRNNSFVTGALSVLHLAVIILEEPCNVSWKLNEKSSYRLSCLCFPSSWSVFSTLSFLWLHVGSERRLSRCSSLLILTDRSRELWSACKRHAGRVCMWP
jgi:hypothetical protein